MLTKTQHPLYLLIIFISFLLLVSTKSYALKEGRDHAIFFAINNYQDSVNWTELKHPIKEAEVLAGVLKEYYDFDTIINRNPTKNEIEKVLIDLGKKSFNENAQLLIFFSGHGYFDTLYKQGYFIPSDNTDPEMGLALTGLGRMISSLPPKHILLAIDACYSGTINPDIAFKNPTRKIDDILKRVGFIKRQMAFKTRIVITSGGKERTPDKSEFADAILTGLKYAFREGDGIFSYSDLVARLERVKPIPFHGRLMGDDKGGFVFVVHPKYFHSNTELNSKESEADRKINRGLEYFNNEQYEQAFLLLFKHRNSIYFSSTAMNKLGIMYGEGLGVTQDEKEALIWLEKSANLGNPLGQFNLGNLYYFRFGDLDNAIHWYRQAAENGNASGQVALGMCYYNGEGVPQDNRVGTNWIKKAAEQSNEQAMVNLGFAYLKGKGIPQNEKKAFIWFEKSAELGNATGQYNLAQFYEQGIVVNKNLKRAIAIYEGSAKKGYPPAKKAVLRLKK